MSELFLADDCLIGLKVDPMYLAIRDSGNFKSAKERLEKVFDENARFIGDPLDYFKKQLSERFEDNMWHLCLMEMLRKEGFTLEKAAKRGPDIKASRDGKTFWFEAINSGLGPHIENLAYNEHGVAVEMGQPNDPRVTSRLSSAVVAKSEKYKNYIPDPVAESDIKLIAVSAHKNDRARRSSKNRSFMDIVLYDQIVIPNPSGGADIDLGIFHQKEHEHIDGVIYCPLDPLNYLDSENILEWYIRQ